MDKMKLKHLTEAARDALEDRGIPAELAAQYGTCSATDERGSDDWIAFRHKHDGKVAHVAYRTLGAGKRFRQSPNTTRVLWNADAAIEAAVNSDGRLIIFEGHIDALTGLVCGFEASTSVPDGAPPVSKSAEGEASDAKPKTKYEFLDRHDLAGIKEIILATDNDGPGIQLRNDLAVRLGKKRCKWVQYPEGCKDLNDVYLTHGVEAARAVIENARWIVLDGLYNYEDVPYEPPEIPVQIGIAGLDDLWQVSCGRLTVFTGAPSHGKSQLITDVVCHLAENHHWVIAIASFEDSIRRMLVPRLMRWKLRFDPARATKEEHDWAAAWVNDHFVFIQPPEDGDEDPTVDWYLERVEAAVLRRNVKFAILDPWNEIDHMDRAVDVTEHEDTGIKLRKIRRHAKRFNYHTAIAAHPTKIQNKQDGKVRIAGGYDISGSSNWFNKPDTGLTVFRDFEENTTTVVCWKAKSQGVIGMPGQRKFRFMPDGARYQYTPELQEVSSEPSEYQGKTSGKWRSNGGRSWHDRDGA